MPRATGPVRNASANRWTRWRRTPPALKASAVRGTAPVCEYRSQRAAKPVLHPRSTQQTSISLSAGQSISGNGPDEGTPAPYSPTARAAEPIPRVAVGPDQPVGYACDRRRGRFRLRRLPRPERGVLPVRAPPRHVASLTIQSMSVSLVEDGGTFSTSTQWAMPSSRWARRMSTSRMAASPG
jgi:hypothetical protein